MGLAGPDGPDGPDELELGLGLDWAGFDRAMRPRKQPLRRFQAAAQPIRKPSRAVFRNRPHLEIQRLFRYGFDSSKAPKTMRWRRFSGG